MCGKRRKASNCVHPCTLLCHPGPCPPCVAMLTKLCDCGKESKSLRCDKASVIKCDQVSSSSAASQQGRNIHALGTSLILKVCGKLLRCKKHKCGKTCHAGACDDCEEIVEVECFCGKDKSVQPCAEVISQYSCKQVQFLSNFLKLFL